MEYFPTWAKNCQDELVYFLGLITGRGSLEISKKIIVIEFPYAKPLEGIPYCPECHVIMKGFSQKACKTHGEKTPAFEIGPFDQENETESSIKKIVIPTLQKITQNIPITSRAITTGGGRTFVSVEFKTEQEIFNWILEQFEPHTNYNSFEIPKGVHDLEYNLKKEYISGITDTAGFPKWANFSPAMLNEGNDRARMYFQFVRNWKLPVQFCNLLEIEMGIPVDTIRWGHPNIDDTSRNDYDKNGFTMFREHQMKIFAENFQPEFHKFEYKKKILRELHDYNKSINFAKNDMCKPPKSVKVKVSHPGEDDARLPSEIKNKHFDAYWQICWKMGCNLCKQISNPEYAYLTGKDEKFLGNIEDTEKELQEKRDKKYENAKAKRPEKEKSSKKPKKKKTISEDDTYVPLQKWLAKYLTMSNPNKQIISEIVATTTLSKLTSIQHIPKIVELVQDLEIRPDVVGFVEGGEMTFVESKITALNIANVGQLIGYCMIADPEYAYLISSKPVSASLKKILQVYPELLEYNGKKIRIGTLEMKTEKVEFT